MNFGTTVSVVQLSHFCDSGLPFNSVEMTLKTGLEQSQFSRLTQPAELSRITIYFIKIIP